MVTLQVIDSVKLVRDFGADSAQNGVPGFWVRNLDQPFRTAVRRAVKAHGMNEMAIQATAAEDVDRVVVQAYNQKMGLNTEQYVALQAIQMQRDVCATSGSCTFIFGANATPLLNLRQ